MLLLKKLLDLKYWLNFFRILAYLKITYAPNCVFIRYIAGRFYSSRLTKLYLHSQQLFREQIASLQLTSDWFTGSIPFWLSVFDESRFSSKSEIKALEIGSWEGLSGHFILRTLPKATLTCVDTWEGSDEHKSGFSATKDVLSNVESSFDNNLSMFKDRLTKYKGTSFSFFKDNPGRNVFDLIYVDGSHHCDDVVIDAIKCFEMLKVGGILIFDDYLWEYYSKAIDNPAAAINVFLRLKTGSFKVVHIYHQIIIKKTNDRCSLEKQRPETEMIESDSKVDGSQEH